MLLKITSSGGFRNAKFLLEDGSELPKVRGATVRLSCMDIVRAEVEMLMTEVDVVAEADVLVTTLPNGKRYKLVPLEAV